MPRLVSYVALAMLASTGMLVTHARAGDTRAARCPIGSFPGGLFAVPSPTGRQIAIARSSGPSRIDLWIASLTNGRERRVATDLPYGLRAFAWSADGEMLALTRGDSLSVVPAAGGAERVLYQSGAGTELAVDGWNPDEDRSVLVTRANSTNANSTEASHELLVSVVDGSVSDLGPGHDGSFSQQNSIAFYRSNAVDIYSLADGSVRKIAALSGIRQTAIAWSTDGRLLAYGDEVAPGVNRLVIATTDLSPKLVVGHRLFGGGIGPVWSGPSVVTTPVNSNHGGIVVTNPISGRTRSFQPLQRKLVRKLVWTGVLGAFPRSGRVLYEVDRNGVSQGLRSVRRDGHGDAPLLPCRGK